jgi:hypothetical protein
MDEMTYVLIARTTAGALTWIGGIILMLLPDGPVHVVPVVTSEHVGLCFDARF